MNPREERDEKYFEHSSNNRLTDECDNDNRWNDDENIVVITCVSRPFQFHLDGRRERDERGREHLRVDLPWLAAVGSNRKRERLDSK